MEEQRAQTFEALNQFIETQKTLLARTKADIDHLCRLRGDLVQIQAVSARELTQEISNEDSDENVEEGDESMSMELDEEEKEKGPVDTLMPKMEALLEELSNPSVVSNSSDYELHIPKNIHWGLFEAHDPSPLHTLTLTKQQAYAQRNQPFTSQRWPPSPLQQFVRAARVRIVDPILTSDTLSSLLATLDVLIGDEEDEEEDPEEAAREREREKIRELKKRKIQGSGLHLPSAGLRLGSGFGLGRTKGDGAVFVRYDVEDESGEVDIDLDEVGGGGGGADVPMDVNGEDEEDGEVMLGKRKNGAVNGKAKGAAKAHVTKAVPEDSPPKKKARISQAVAKPKHKTKAPSNSKSKGKAKSKSNAQSDSDVNELDSDEEETASTSMPKLYATKSISTPKVKQKPETYKQAWSVEEQHLLEQLLEKIPDGEKFRWQKISRAMDGKRTPRQVASRVQKYFEKLKKFGIEGG
ncbi:hypothetical protein BDQ12DRAFT_739395 [Crucibulum laeve]|uniref:Uncharacterized protein n=1 Tax=Crucibulum laeve TaxID=68775 RepID=A0A5C3LUG5_9AGAR|nr:hypothetical protein BDQ12DRAFT_739395 [Crucibulum laeve]